uniref:Developmentally-regulated GTP-binding protein 2 n=1 Tax=Arundo donax TaxID=35708 RepID=A0A0A9F8Z6_ARUDO
MGNRCEALSSTLWSWPCSSGRGCCPDSKKEGKGGGRARPVQVTHECTRSDIR